MSELNAEMLAERRVVDAVIACLPMSDDGTGHVADCGWTDDEMKCGCVTLPSRIADVIRGALASEKAAREEAVRKFEQQVEFRREYERMAEKAEQERDDMERELRKSVRLEGERALASAAAKAQVAALSDEVRVQIVARDGQYDRALIAEAMLQIERDRYAALRDGVAGFVAAWRLAIKHEHAAAAPPLPTPDDLEAALLTRVDAPKPDATPTEEN